MYCVGFFIVVGGLLFENWLKIDWVLIIYLIRCLYKLLCLVDGWVGLGIDRLKNILFRYVFEDENYGLYCRYINF